MGAHEIPDGTPVPADYDGDGTSPTQRISTPRPQRGLLNNPATAIASPCSATQRVCPFPPITTVTARPTPPSNTAARGTASPAPGRWRKCRKAKNTPSADSTGQTHFHAVAPVFDAFRAFRGNAPTSLLFLRASFSSAPLPPLRLCVNETEITVEMQDRRARWFRSKMGDKSAAEPVCPQAAFLIEWRTFSTPLEKIAFHENNSLREAGPGFGQSDD